MLTFPDIINNRPNAQTKTETKGATNVINGFIGARLETRLD